MGMQQVTLPAEVIDTAQSAAQGRGVSMAEFISESLRMRLDADRQMEFLDRRASDVDIEAVIEMVRNAPDVPPEEGDEMPEDGAPASLTR